MGTRIKSQVVYFATIHKIARMQHKYVVVCAEDTGTDRLSSPLEPFLW